MAQKKTPGVYIEEKSAFPNSVVEVATGVPAFLGYTATAMDGTKPLTGVPTRITNMTQFVTLYGGAPKRVYARKTDGEVSFEITGQNFYLFHALRLYFNNGGGPCWIVSVGAHSAESHSASDFTDAVWANLAKVQEPSIYVIPDAVALDQAEYKILSERAISECAKSMSRVAILDVFDGANDRIQDVIDGPQGFRKLSLPEEPSYGMAYYPWLNTNIIEAGDIDFTNLDDDSRSALATEISTDADQGLQDLAAKITDAPETALDARKTHNALLAKSSIYAEAMKGLLEAQNVLPPSAALAGIFARTDAARGVFKAPANTGVVSVLSPTVAISDEQQKGLNVPMYGQAVNAIRSFVGRGVLVWGARTLDGNSQDYRYINVRRTLIMLEQSIFFAAQSYVFEPNVAGTWSALKTMIENFLNNQWNAGALAGSTPAEAFDVSVGLGSTMTGNDILDGYMRITVRVAISRPAEFIVITFQQKMQTS